MSVADTLKERGKDRMEYGTSRAFVLQVRERLVIIAKHRTVTSDDARIQARVLGLTPPSKQVWGAIFRGKGWHCVGWLKSSVVSNHAHQNRVWEWRG